MLGKQQGEALWSPQYDYDIASSAGNCNLRKVPNGSRSPTPTPWFGHSTPSPRLNMRGACTGKGKRCLRRRLTTTAPMYSPINVHVDAFNINQTNYTKNLSRKWDSGKKKYFPVISMHILQSKCTKILLSPLTIAVLFGMACLMSWVRNFRDKGAATVITEI